MLRRKQRWLGVWTLCMTAIVAMMVGCPGPVAGTQNVGGGTDNTDAGGNTGGNADAADGGTQADGGGGSDAGGGDAGGDANGDTNGGAGNGTNEAGDGANDGETPEGGTGAAGGDEGGGSGNFSMTEDSDGDGFTDFEEANAVPGSDPMNAADTPTNPIDTDGDGCSDFDEVTFANFCDNNPNTAAGEDIAANATFEFTMTVARHVDEAYTESQVDSQLDKSGEILRNLHTECADIETGVTFVRSGAMDTFDVGAAVVTSEDVLTQLFALPFDVKIVNLMVGVCGITDPNDMTVIVGCALSGGTLVITTVADTDVWAHEWGHVQGLGHRDECARNLMHAFEVNTNAVNEAERTAFLTPTPVFGLARTAQNTTSPSMSKSPQFLHRAEDETIESWVDRMVTKRYLSGVPSAYARNLRPQAITHLRQILDTAPGYVRCNAIRVLGLAGEAELCPRLITNVLDPVGELSAAEYIEAVESILALGRLIDHDDTGVARDWLIEGTDPAAWQHRNIQWSYAAMEGKTLYHNLAKLSIMALSLTKDPAAKIRLEALADPEQALADQKAADQELESNATIDPLTRQAREALSLQNRKSKTPAADAPKRYR